MQNLKYKNSKLFGRCISLSNRSGRTPRLSIAGFGLTVEAFGLRVKEPQIEAALGNRGFGIGAWDLVWDAGFFWFLREGFQYIVHGRCLLFPCFHVVQEMCETLNP